MNDLYFDNDDWLPCRIVEWKVVGNDFMAIILLPDGTYDYRYINHVRSQPEHEGGTVVVPRPPVPRPNVKE